MKKYSRFIVLLFLISCTGEKNDFAYKVNPIYPVTINHKMSEASVSFNTPKIDILWVIDNSGSMASAQNSVITNTSAFIQAFTQSKNIDWKMGLISTDIADMPYIGFEPGDELSSTAPGNPVQRFQSAVGNLGTNGDSTERSFDPIVNNLKKYNNFLRDGAYLAIILVTDEDEQSDKYRTAQSMIDEVTKLKNNDSSLIIGAGVFSTYDFGLKCSSPFSSTTGFSYINSQYESFINLTGGSYYDICNPNFGNLLSTLGQNLVSKISKLVARIVLQSRPIVSTIKINYLGQDLAPGAAEEGGHWVYDPTYNVIIIHDKNVINGNVKDILIQYDTNPDYRE